MSTCTALPRVSVRLVRRRGRLPARAGVAGAKATAELTAAAAAAATAGATQLVEGVVEEVRHVCVMPISEIDRRRHFECGGTRNGTAVGYCGGL